tara:strand:- start:48 stop:341 length:294 start_codon:yes stop_codon:yes gene_type:complete
MPSGDYTWGATISKNMQSLEGDYLFAMITDGGCDITTNNAGLSVKWGVYAPVEGGGMSDCRAKGEIKFTSWASVSEERKAAKRIARSTLNALEKAYS